MARGFRRFGRGPRSAQLVSESFPVRVQILSVAVRRADIAAHFTAAGGRDDVEEEDCHCTVPISGLWVGLRLLARQLGDLYRARRQVVADVRGGPDVAV